MTPMSWTADFANTELNRSLPHGVNRRNTPQDLRRLRRYGRRWKIERLLAWLQNIRRSVVRDERHVENCLGMFYLGCCLILLRHLPAWVVVSTLRRGRTCHVPHAQKIVFLPQLGFSLQCQGCDEEPGKQAEAVSLPQSSRTRLEALLRAGALVCADVMSLDLTRQGSTVPSSLKPAQICLIHRHLAVIRPGTAFAFLFIVFPMESRLHCSLASMFRKGERH